MKKQNAFNAKHEKKIFLSHNKRSKLIDQIRILLSKQSNKIQYNEKNNLINEKKKMFHRTSSRIQKKKRANRIEQNVYQFDIK